MKETEIKRFGAEMRASAEEDMKVEGYALKFDTETIIGSGWWAYREKISKAAFDNADLSNVVFDFNHSLDSVMARSTNNSLSLTVDSVGLKMSAKIIDTTDGTNLFKRIKDGLINKMSFWAVIKKSKWIFNEDGSDEMDLREIVEFGRFIDVAAVTFPAYDDTSITTRGKSALYDFTAEQQERKNQIYSRQIRRMEKILKGEK